MKVIIMRGIPGGGKSTYIQKNFPNAIVCSADHSFETDEGYKFDPSKIGEAHRACQKKFLTHLLSFRMAGEQRDVVVDNTNTQLWEMSFYVGLANVFEVPFEIHRIDCDPKVAAARNVHGVPEKAVLAMHSRMEKALPFWNEKVVKVD